MGCGGGEDEKGCCAGWECAAAAAAAADEEAEEEDDDDDDEVRLAALGSGERLEFSLAVLTVRMTGARSMLFWRDLGRDAAVVVVDGSSTSRLSGEGN